MNAPKRITRSLVGAAFFGSQLVSLAAWAQVESSPGKPPPQMPVKGPAASRRGETGDQEPAPDVNESPTTKEGEGKQPPDEAGKEGTEDGTTSAGNEPQYQGSASDVPVTQEAEATPPDPAAQSEGPAESISPPEFGGEDAKDAGALTESQLVRDDQPPAPMDEARALDEVPVGVGAGVSQQDRVPSNPHVAPEHPSHFRKGLTVVPRLALAVGGWTQFGEECSASGQLSCDDGLSFGRRESSGVSLGVDGLYQLIPSLRLGVAAGVIPSVRGDGGDVRERFGTEAGISGIAEGVIDVTRSMAVSIRGQVGASMLWTAGRAQEEIDGAIRECDQVRQEGIDCVVEYGPFVAPSYGVGAGFLWPVAKRRLRLDLLYQTSKRTLYRQEAESSDSVAKVRATMNVSRLWLSLAFEI